MDPLTVRIATQRRCLLPPGRARRAAAGDRRERHVARAGTLLGVLLGAILLSACAPPTEAPTGELSAEPTESQGSAGVAADGEESDDEGSLGAGEASSDDTPSSDALFAFVLLTTDEEGETAALGRVVLPLGAACPRLLGEDGGALETSARVNPDPELFPVEVCEAVLELGASATVEGGDLALPAVTRSPERVAVIGDTGCDGDDEDCADPSYWPYPLYAQAIADAGTDLVLHLGDYNYRGTPGHVVVDGTKESTYDAGDHAAEGSCEDNPFYVSQESSETPNDWDSWRLDFFEPSAPMLAAAPMLATRGNHELCSRAGPGWFYFLSPLSPLLGAEPGSGCPPPDAEDPLHFLDPYLVSLESLDVLMLDSTNACDAGDLHVEEYADQMERIAALVGAEPGRPTVLASHRPIYAVAPDEHEEREGEPVVINETLQQAIAIAMDGSLPADIGLLVAGHMHSFQATSPAGARAPQLVIGSGGVDIEGTIQPEELAMPVDGMETAVLSLAEHGYLDVELGAKGAWTGALISTDGETITTLATCGSSEEMGALVCRKVE